ncbi:MAG: hypothetical protein NZ521_05715, partial [Flammeovirgaceae bacterium]|nr:hypothetical protein [Flammeovirgaceae bacterium]MDW8287729.1 hypothetical protein [Flammeovirgaceae bacterium]
MKYIATVVFFLSFFPLVWSQSENKGWKFLYWGMSEKEAEATVLQVTRQQPLWQENVLSFPYEGVFVTCYFDKGLSRIVETQEFHYPDSAQTAQAFDS